MSTNIFHNASLNLTTKYLAIIMLISLMFSIGLYRVSSQELERTIRKPESAVERLVQRRDQALHKTLLDEQNEELKESRKRLVDDLVIINLFIIVAGGLLSYYLARKTLQPIEEAHEAQSRFTADASHELRTPITAMRAETELALTEPKLTLRQAKEQLSSNMEELDKLTALSDGLLSLARLENNELIFTDISLEQIINTSADRVKPLAEKKKQIIKTSKIPEISIQAEEISLVEALITLIDNAVKYSPPKSIIKINVKAYKQKITISIIDKGQGIKATELPHIFERFYRADQSRNKNQIGGYGIGLSIAKATIEAHAGKITVTSTPEKGSTFTVQLSLS